MTQNLMPPSQYSWLQPLSVLQWSTDYQRFSSTGLSLVPLSPSCSTSDQPSSSAAAVPIRVKFYEYRIQM